jgi:hypothetical protein
MNRPTLKLSQQWGVAVIYFVLTPVETNYLLQVAGEPGLHETFLPKTVGILAGVYVIVRGLDNMSRELPASWALWWNRLFSKVSAER